MKKIVSSVNELRENRSDRSCGITLQVTGSIALSLDSVHMVFLNVNVTYS